MANSEHLMLLKKGVKAWNKYREERRDLTPDLSGLDLSSFDLKGANLRSTDLTQATLTQVDLTDADLCDAILTRADLVNSVLIRVDFIEAELRRANLNGADLTGADLTKANLSNANLDNAILRGVIFRKTILSLSTFHNANIEQTVFVDCDLSAALALDTIIHSGPSTIGIDTIYLSKGNISSEYLLDAGVPDSFVKYMPSLVVDKAFEYYSCFISYTEVDDALSKRIYEDLQAAGLRVWRWRDDAKWGAPIEKNIDQAVRIFDKLIVICSRDSLNAPAVIDEIDRAFQKEQALLQDGKIPEVLFPITLDDHIFNHWDHYLKPKVLAKTVGDFRGWQDPMKYDVALQRLISALKQ